MSHPICVPCSGGSRKAFYQGFPDPLFSLLSEEEGQTTAISTHLRTNSSTRPAGAEKLAAFSLPRPFSWLLSKGRPRVLESRSSRTPFCVPWWMNMSQSSPVPLFPHHAIHSAPSTSRRPTGQWEVGRSQAHARWVRVVLTGEPLLRNPF